MTSSNSITVSNFCQKKQEATNEGIRTFAQQILVFFANGFSFVTSLWQGVNPK
jgi:hypothetical protein